MKKKSNIRAVMCKEFSRFFGDRRLVLTTILLPGLMIYLLYSLMGGAMGSLFAPDEDYIPVCAAVNMPEGARQLFEAASLSFDPIDSTEVETYKDKIRNEEADLLLVFGDNADKLFSGTVPEEDVSGQIKICFNSARTESAAAYSAASAVLDGYKDSLLKIYDGPPEDLATAKATVGQIFSMMMPMLLMMFMFSGCMAVAPESIAGEKERGTIATLLVTPLRRSELALGKVFSLGIIAMLSGISSTVGTVLSLPKLMNMERSGIDMGAASYRVSDYLALGCVILSTVLLLVAIISCISAYARSVKEASTTLSPLMVLTMLLGVLAMFGKAKTGMGYYFIPLYNSVQSMAAIFSFSMNPLHIAVTCATNALCLVLLIYLLTKMFDSEKIMFGK